MKTIFYKNRTIGPLIISIIASLFIMNIIILLNPIYFVTIYRVSYPFSVPEIIRQSPFDAVVGSLLSLIIIIFFIHRKGTAVKQIAASSVIVISAVIILILSTYSSNPNLPRVLFLLSGIAAFAHYYSQYRKGLVIYDKAIIYKTAIITTIALESISIGTWLVYAFFDSKIYSDSSWVFALFENHIFSLIGLVSPYLMILLAIPFATIQITRYLMPKSPQVIMSSDFLTSRIRKAILGLAIFLPFGFLLYAYSPGVNPDLQNLGVDIDHYLNWISQVNSGSSFSDVLHNAFVRVTDGDRPLSYFIILGIWKVSGLELVTVLRFMPLVLSPALLASVYYFLRQSTANKDLVVLSLFFTAVSYHIIIGIYAGFYANWLALCLTYVAGGLLFKLWKNPRSRTALIFICIASVATLFLHVYTWTYMMFLITGFLLFNVISDKSNIDRKKVALILFIVALNVSIDAARIYGLGAKGGFERDLEVANESAGLDQFVLRHSNLRYTFAVYVGGLLNNPLILGLALIFVIMGRRLVSDILWRYLLIALTISIIPILFGDEIIKTRIIYNIPIQVAAALGALIVMSLLQDKRYKILFVTAIILFMINYGFRGMANLYLLPPT